MKWGLRDQRTEKWLNNGDFQVAVSLLYAHFPLPCIFIYLFEHYGEVLQSAKIQEKV